MANSDSSRVKGLLSDLIGLPSYSNICSKRKEATSRENLFSGVPTRSDTNQAAQPREMARGLKCRIYGVEGVYYLCSENEDADLRGNRAADMRFCFCICKKRSHDAVQIVFTR